MLTARHISAPISRRRYLQALALSAGLPWAGAVQASSARILVGFAPGGSADLLARLLAEGLAAEWGEGRALVVDNRAGGAGRLAVDQLRLAPDDGRTLLLAPLVTPVLSQLVFRQPGYDPGVDMQPVSLIAHFQFALAVHPDHPAHSVADFIAWLKAHPQQANFGSPSPGSLPHFFGLLLGQQAGVEMLHVAYRGGTPMLADLMGGQISSGINIIQELLPLQQSGKIRVLGVFAAQRVRELPEIPTFAELGYPAAQGSGWYSLWTTAGTPPALVARWNRAVAAVLQQSAVRQRLAEWALEPAHSTPPALEALRRADIEKWRPIIAGSGLRLD